ncbi:hypothetical protein ABIA15_005297 [Sinorhizobium fredii]
MPDPRFSQSCRRNLVSLEHEPDVDVEPVSHQLPDRRFQGFAPFAAGEEGHVVGKRQRPEVELYSLLALEYARADCGTSAKSNMGVGKPGLKPYRYGAPGADEFPKANWDFQEVGKKSSESLGPFYLIGERRRMTQLGFIDQGGLTVSLTTEAETCQYGP